jgi:integrase
MHNDFTLFMRTYPNGTKVVFYHAYDADDKRVGPWTTKCTNKTAARNYCNKLLKEGRLLPKRNKIIVFAKFADGFWDRKSEYIRRQESRSDITDTYLKTASQYVKNQILPFFGTAELDKITEEDINNWLLGFRNRGKRDIDGNIIGYKNSYANNALSVINVMMMESVRRKLIATNPCANVRKLKKDSREVEIFSIDEVNKLFPKNPLPIWGNKEVVYAANRLSSLTGMRIGEVLGLKGEYVFDSYIRVCGQYGDYGYKDYTKTKENRNIPLHPDMLAILHRLMEKNGNGFIFSHNGGVTPVDQKTMRKEFHRALKRIGMTDDEIKKRALTPHSWRHFVNTELQMQGLSISQVQSVTGHNSVRMTEHYSHLDARQISEITKAQAAILGNDKTEEKPARSGGTARVLKLVKKPEQKKTDKRRQA